MQRVINFSGGKTSAYMTIKYYQPDDLVIFCDTGREHPKTYKFIHDFEAHEGIPVIQLKYKDEDDPFGALLSSKKNREIPNQFKRFCTDHLKIKVAKRYLRSIGVRKFENLIGFRADEPRRVLNRKKRFVNVVDKFPLYEDGISREMIDAYWSTKPYILEIPRILGNCTLCFMKGQNAIMTILREYPELAIPWIEDEERSEQESLSRGQKPGSGRRYFHNITIKQLRDMAQNNLFKDYDLNNIKPAFNCACTN